MMQSMDASNLPMLPISLKDSDVESRAARAVGVITPPISDSDFTTSDHDGEHVHSSFHDALPEFEMSYDLAVAAINTKLALDGDPTRNLGTFVTTIMNADAEELLVASLKKNLVNYQSYPATSDIHDRCLRMIASLFHAPLVNSFDQPVGTSTTGSSEAIMMATLAMKKRWIRKRKSAGQDFNAPNLVMSSAVHVCWKKAMLYFDIEGRYVDCTCDGFTMDPRAAVSMVDENTIGICAILGTTYTGEYEDIATINAILKEKDLDVPIHVDAASGGFVAPFVDPNLRWDFRLDKVASINVSGHKYGLVYAGIGWIVWRNPEYLPDELVFELNYLGTAQNSSTINFSRSASHVISQYLMFMTLGRQGYSRVMHNLFDTTEYVASGVLGMRDFELVHKMNRTRLPLLGFRLNSTRSYTFDEFAVADELRRHGGWMVPAYTMPAPFHEVKMLRIVVREDLSRALCDVLLTDLRSAMKCLGGGREMCSCTLDTQ